jgi:hypothetical protein
VTYEKQCPIRMFCLLTSVCYKFANIDILPVVRMMIP